MKIAICDGSTKFLQAFRTELYKYNPEISLVCYSGYQDLTRDFAVITFDAVIINTEISGESGIDTAVELVRKKPDTEVIFITEKPDKYYQLIFSHANIMKPYGLLVKPVSRVFMHHLIGILEQTVRRKQFTPLVFKTPDKEIVTIPISGIKYIEHINRMSYVHTDGELIQCTKTIQYFEKSLPDGQFLHASKSLIVNADKVITVQQNAITLDNEETIYSSRNYKKIFLDEYLKFVRSNRDRETEPFFL